MILRQPTLSLIALTLIASSASFASIVTTTSRTTWEAGVQSETTIDFDTAATGYTPPSANNYTNVGTSLILGGITFTDLGYTALSAQSMYASNYNLFNSHTILKGTTSDFTQPFKLVLNLPTNTLAFGTDVMVTEGASYVRVKIDGVDMGQVATAAAPARAFFGATSTTAMNVIEIFYGAYNNTGAGVNNTAALDNVSLATPLAQQGAATPELANLLLCASGLIFLSRWKRRAIMHT